MTTLAPTLYTRTFPRAAGWLRDLVLILLGALFIAALAQVEIPLPFTPVPITGQTFGVLLVGAALGSKRGINRAGYFVMPMDETLAVAAIDLSGRPFTVVNLPVKAARVGDLPVELVQDFFEGFAAAARANVHVKVMYGRSNHHKIEACFKAFARALRAACSKDKRLAKMLPSTKGLL